MCNVAILGGLHTCVTLPFLGGHMYCAAIFLHTSVTLPFLGVNVHV